ncbi:hypothetical protein IFT47_21880 [Pseudomonas sp. CFBP 13711]|uniref:hypothetical protein n=1 Tax=unclassified Pseudomonas TaxID=196821 RepID=UPI00178514D9|nr:MULTISPECIES: hypothetical protein [unclassified Pseudomonas]MBD8709287.1 hypothetical protein [Pseudomonas sp. CFBP 13711]MBD8714323.1 hypothetical protein [Pseudomonas sp. CFBP 13715]
MHRKKLLIVGGGNLCLQILQILAPRNQFEFHVAGRDLEKATRMCNLIRLAALQQNVTVQIHSHQMDLRESCISRNAETLLQIRPDIILNCASLQSWRVITQLPAERFAALDQAQLGPWLPMHLAPAYALMRAVKQSCPKSLVVNAAFPDAVNPILYKVGMAPDIGIGNIANLIPATRSAVAHLSGCLPTQVCAKLVGHHYFSHSVPRHGLPPQRLEASFNLTYWIDGEERTDEHTAEAIFGCVAREFSRLGGVDGQYLTAMSAVTVLENLHAEHEVRVHGPGPQGLPGGYPVKVGMGKVLLDLPYGVTREEAIKVNEAGQRLDGIQLIRADGTAVFGEAQMQVMQRELNFAMAEMRVCDAAAWAEELGSKYLAYAEGAQHNSGHHTGVAAHAAGHRAFAC